MEKRPFTEMFAGKIEVTSGNSFLIGVLPTKRGYYTLSKFNIKSIIPINFKLYKKFNLCKNNYYSTDIKYGITIKG